MLEAERHQVAAASRRLAEQGLVVGTSGNLSARRDDRVAITPTGARLGDLRPEEVTVVDLDGRVAWGELEHASELALHLGVYRRYRAGAGVHTHSPLATALSCVLDDELPCVHYQMLLLGGSVRVADYATFGSPELAAAVMEALDGRTAALMANHGAIAYGADMDAAAELAELLEQANVDTSLLVRRAEVQTSASVLPIRPNGDRPAFHVVGANATYGVDDAPWEAIAAASHLHLGGPEFMGGEAAAEILGRARAEGVVTSADVLAAGGPGPLGWIGPDLPPPPHLSLT